MRRITSPVFVALIGPALWSASQAQAPMGQMGTGHVGMSAPRVDATTPSAIQSTVGRHIGFPSAGAWQQEAGDQGRGTVASCARRFKSYDVSSGTYLGRDGRRHACP
jgi:BA14K-like protein